MKVEKLGRRSIVLDRPCLCGLGCCENEKNAACWDGADSLQVKPVGAGGQTLQN